jgi:hypothetical protein
MNIRKYIFGLVNYEAEDEFRLELVLSIFADLYYV